MMVQQLRFTLTIVVVLFAMTTVVYSQSKKRIIEIGSITLDDGPPVTDPDQQRKDELAKQLAAVDDAKKDVIVYLKKEIKKEPVDVQGKAAALSKLQGMSDKLVETVYPDMAANEKTSMKQYVYNDLLEQCKCEASAEVQGIAPNCKRAAQQKLQAAVS